MSHTIPVCLILVMTHLTAAADEQQPSSSSPTPLTISHFSPHDHNILLLNRLIVDPNLSPGCRSSLTDVRTSLSQGEDWSFRMASSFSHVPPDVRSPHLVDMGHFDSCLAISQPGFKGKYCLYRQHFNLSHESTARIMSKMPDNFQKFLKLETVAGSICLPSKCSDHEIVQHILQPYMVLPGTQAEVRMGCESNDQEDEGRNTRRSEEAREERVFQLMLGAWVLFVLVASFLSKRRPDNSFLSCFRLRKNMDNVFAPTDRQQEHAFMYGYRMLFLTTATMMHVSHMQVHWSPLTITNLVHHNGSKNWFMNIAGSHFSHSMCSSITWGGFLSFAGRLRELRTKGRFNFVKSFTTRFLRTIPTIACCYVILLAVPRSYFNGPVFRQYFSAIRSNCASQFWREVTFSQNGLRLHESCHPATWIVGVDMHLFAASFPLIFLYNKRPFGTKVLLVVLTIASCVAQAIYVQVNNYPAYLDFSSYDLHAVREQVWLHVSTINYVSSYLIGMFVAILLHERLDVRGKRIRILAAIFFITSYLSTFYWPHTWKSRTDSVPRWEQVAYASTYRTIIGAACAAMLFHNATLSDAVARLFSARLFVIIGRFNFSTYMSTFLVIFLEVFSARRPLDLDTYSVFCRTCYTIVFGTGIGFLMHLLVEAPFIRISRWIFAPAASLVGKGSPSTRSSDQNNNNNNESALLTKSTLHQKVQ